MTGRHLYDKYTDAVAAKTYPTWCDHHGPFPAWPLLTYTERSVWNDTARRLTPKRPKAVSKA